jgi:hypothetical protein
MSSSTNRFDAPDGVGYDPTTDTYHSEYDRGDADSLSFTIVTTVSIATGQETTAMEPLYSSVDPDALEALFAHTRGDTVRASFSYEECTVTIGGSGEIVVQPEK